MELGEAAKGLQSQIKMITGDFNILSKAVTDTHSEINTELAKTLQDTTKTTTAAIKNVENNFEALGIVPKLFSKRCRALSKLMLK